MGTAALEPESIRTNGDVEQVISDMALERAPHRRAERFRISVSDLNV